MNKLKLSEISNLINIRNYLSNAVNNFSIDKVKVNKIGKIIISLDNNIIDAIITESESNNDKNIQ